MSGAADVLAVVYVAVVAMYGQLVLSIRMIAWVDRRYVQPWLVRRAAAAPEER